MLLTTPYLQLQAIRRDYRMRGLFTYPKPFTYIVDVDFPNAGNVAAGESAKGTVLIDSDSDFVWNRLGWYAQDALFAPPQSLSANTEDSTWETNRAAVFEFAFRDIRSGRLFHGAPFVEATDFSGWIGVATPGGVQEQYNGADVLGVAGNDTGIGHLPHYFPEPVILTASTLFEVTVRNRTSAASTFSSHLIALHGARLTKLN